MFSRRLLSRKSVIHARCCRRSLSTFSLFEDSFRVDEKSFETEEQQQAVLANIRLRDTVEDFPSLFQEKLTSSGLKSELMVNARRLPNSYHPVWNTKACDLDVVDIVGKRPEFDFKPQKAETILFKSGFAKFSDLKSGRLGIPGGKRSYTFNGRLAKLARVLAKWTLGELVREHQFTPVVIPNLIKADIIRACGFDPDGPRTQVYSLQSSPNTCLAGTAEMPLASLHLGETFASQEELPKKYCALSRCYRAEAKSGGEMSGLYRVHYFDKVEMFALTEPEQSEKTFEEFITIQRSLYEKLGLYFRIIDMPPYELGPSAHRKYDMETLMPGRDNFWGEISSASNCTDYQARRLNITYKQFLYNAQQEIVGVDERHVHTVNGTACAVPRILISIVEQNQLADGRVRLPEILQPAMAREYL